MIARYCSVAALLSISAIAQVPVEREPRHHLEFSDDRMRVISPRIPAGDTTLDHLHSHDGVTIAIDCSEVRAKQPGSEWSNSAAACTPGRVAITEYTGKPRSHIVQNIGSGVYHLVLVENLRDDGWTSIAAVSVTGMKVAKESRSFRIYEMELSNSSQPLHSHEEPTVVVLVSGEALADGKRLAQPGDWAHIPAGEKHQVAAHGMARFVEVEVR